LSGASVIQAATFHLSTQTDAEVGKMPGLLAVGTDHFATGVGLGCKSSRGGLDALFLAIANKVFFILDGLNDRVGGKGGIVIRVTDHGLKVGIVFPKSIDKEGNAQVIVIEQSDCKNTGMERVQFLNDLRHGDPRTEASVESFGDQSDLGVCPKVLMAFTQSAEDGGGSGQAGDHLVVGAGDVQEDERLERAVVSPPSAVPSNIHHDVRLWERAIEPIGESVAIGDQRHLEAPFFPIGFGAIEAEM